MSEEYHSPGGVGPGGGGDGSAMPIRVYGPTGEEVAGTHANNNNSGNKSPGLNLLYVGGGKGNSPALYRRHSSGGSIGAMLSRGKSPTPSQRSRHSITATSPTKPVKELLHTLLHPLDFIQQRKSRSRATSECSEAFEDVSPIGTPRSVTPDPVGRKSKKKYFSKPKDKNIWPVYQPQARQRPTRLQTQLSNPEGKTTTRVNAAQHIIAHQQVQRRHSDVPSANYNRSRNNSNRSSITSDLSSSSSSESISVSSECSCSDEDCKAERSRCKDTKSKSVDYNKRPGISLISRQYSSNRTSGMTSPVRESLPPDFGSVNNVSSRIIPIPKPIEDNGPFNPNTHSYRDSASLRYEIERHVGPGIGLESIRTEMTHPECYDIEASGPDSADGCISSRVKRESYSEGKDTNPSETEVLYSIYDEILGEGQLLRRHSVEPDKRRAHGSGGSMVYLRGEMDPCTAAMLFRDSRGLPAADPFLENIKRSDLEEDETQIFVKFFKYHHCYDLIPISAKLVVFDTRLQVKKAFYALVYNGVRAAPLWDSVRQCFVGMLTITDFIRILQNFYAEPNRKMEELEDHRLETWRTVLKDEDRPLISIKPDESLYEAIRRLIHHKIHRLPVIDHITGNVLYIITHKRILKFLYLYINELPKPFRLQQTLREVQIGTYDGIETAKEETTIIEALNKFVKHRVSALPIVDEEGKLIDIYAKFDVINLAAEGTYNNLDVTLKKANEYRNEWFEQVHRCTQEETLGTILERIVRAEVHRLVVVDQQDKVIGVISLSDILKELVLRPCDDQDPFSLKAATIARMEAALSAEKDSKSPTSPVMNPPSSQDIIDDTQEPQSITTQVNINGLHKTVSDDSVGDKWSSDEKLQRCGSSSSGVGQREDGTDSSQAINKAAVAGAGDSEEDEGRYSMGDMDDSHSSSVVQPEVIPITG